MGRAHRLRCDGKRGIFVKQAQTEVKRKRRGSGWGLLAPLLVVIAGISWGFIGLFSRPLSAAGLQPQQVALLRNGIACLLLLPACWLTGHGRIGLRDVPVFLGSGIISVALFNICYLACQERSSLSVACTLLYTSPCFVMLLSCLLFREKFRAGKALAVLFAMLGCACAAGVFGGGGKLSAGALLLGLGSGLGYALYSIFGKIALRRCHWLAVPAYTFLTAALALLPLSRPGQLAGLMAAQPRLWIYALLLAVVSTVTPFLLYTVALKHMDTGKAALIACVEPAAATLVGAVFFREALTLQSVAGVALIILSIAAVEFLPAGRKQRE